MKNTNQAKAEILTLFEAEPNDELCWLEQNIIEQARKLSVNGMQSMIWCDMSN